MKKLYLIRHAKSSWEDTSLKDFDRPLNKRGQQDAPKMAKRLKEKDIFPDIIITSPAIRTATTCEAFCKILNFPFDRVHREQKLYHAGEEAIFSVLKNVKDLKDKEEVVILFGHNPGLTEFANTLLNEYIENIPTCGIVACKMKIARWKDIQPGSGRMEFFDFPKRLKD